MKEYVILMLIGICLCEDPFTLLGIPTLNPSALFRSNNNNVIRKKVPVRRNKVPHTFDVDNNLSFLQSRDIVKNEESESSKPKSSISTSQITKMIQSSGLTRENGLQAVSRFLLAGNPLSNSVGAIFDKTQFSGISENEVISFDLTERTKQKVRSSANLFFLNNLKNSFYEAIDVRESPTKIHGWNMFNVLMRNKLNNNDQATLTICYPMDSMLVPIGVQKNDCSTEVSIISY